MSQYDVSLKIASDRRVVIDPDDNSPIIYYDIDIGGIHFCQESEIPLKNFFTEADPNSDPLYLVYVVYKTTCVFGLICPIILTEIHEDALKTANYIEDQDVRQSVATKHTLLLPSGRKLQYSSDSWADGKIETIKLRRFTNQYGKSDISH